MAEWLRSAVSMLCGELPKGAIATLGKAVAPRDWVDHSQEPRCYPMRCPMRISVNPTAALPLIRAAMERYAFGPKEGEVYWLLKQVEEDAEWAIEHGTHVNLAHDEFYFITKGVDDRSLMMLKEGVANA